MGTDPSLAQGHPVSKTKFSLSKTGWNWGAVSTDQISRNQSVSWPKTRKWVSASKEVAFGMSNSKFSFFHVLSWNSNAYFIFFQNFLLYVIKNIVYVLNYTFSYYNCTNNHVSQRHNTQEIWIYWLKWRIMCLQLFHKKHSVPTIKLLVSICHDFLVKV
jgi:hypothetical protein